MAKKKSTKKTIKEKRSPLSPQQSGRSMGTPASRKILYGTLLLLGLLGGGVLVYSLMDDTGVLDAHASTTTFTSLPATYTGVTFQNEVSDQPDRGLQFYDYFYNGGGVAIGDLNNDGLPDLYFCGNDVPDRLYLNKGNLQFEDITQQAGIKTGNWSSGVTLVDLNNDGLLDIYVCKSGPYLKPEDTANELYINQGNNRFSEQAAAYGIADNSRSTQATFFDMDRDGDLDLWVMNHALRKRGAGSDEWLERAQALSPEDYGRECSTLYRNDGNQQFTDISAAAGIRKIGFGLGIAVHDFDEDGWLDVYIANDYFIPDFMFFNNGDGTFTDKADLKLGHSPYYAMGCDAADINNDGLTDLMVVDMTPADHVRNKTLMASMDVQGFMYLTKRLKYVPQYMYNSLYLNQGFGVMSDIGLFAGVSQTDWSWAPLLADFDNDGWKDIMVTNGYRKDTKNNDWRNGLNELRQRKGAAYSPADYYEHLQKADVNPVQNQLFKNKGGLEFESVEEEWGFTTPSFSNGAAYGDLDLDGDLDLVINNLDLPAFVYRNNTSEQKQSNFIRFQLRDGKSSQASMHAKICLYTGEQMQCNDQCFTRGYQSYVEPIVHFGLGQTSRVDRVVIDWNDGQRSTIEHPQINQLHLIDKNKIAQQPYERKAKAGSFANITNGYLNPAFRHQENEFNDFAKEVLLPHRQSMLGPAIAVGDVNGDGLEDFYVGGAKYQASALYLQSNDGHFNQQAVTAFSQDRNYEDGGAAFLDVDGDADLDLYVASGGGGDLEGEEELLQDRLYLNDGKGGFQRATDRLPLISSSTKAIAVEDWDKDGDLDIFVGGRTSPGNYPLPPTSYLLINDQGTFTDQTATLAPTLRQAGMITAALWADTDADGKNDLVVVGEWMPISVFKNTGSGLEINNEIAGLENTTGWWNSLAMSDFDGDGDQDIVAGNIGLNNKFHPSPEKPLYVYAHDFDHNGVLDIVLSKIYNGKKVPVRGKECSSEQMPFLNEKFPTYASFANADLTSIYEEEELQEAVQYEAVNFASLYLENQGNGNYKITALANEAQLAPINGIVVKDFNRDGKPDMILAGNRMQTEVETPQYDAGKGLYLQGIGNGKFITSIKMEDTGLFLHDDVQDLKLIHLGANRVPGFLIANNNNKLELYVYRN